MRPSPVPPSPAPHGVFAGLATLDVVHRVDALPATDQKVTAAAQFLAAGGPAANAAVAFAALGGRATLLTALGRGSIAQLIRADLTAHGVEVVDVAPQLEDAAAVSSVAVITGTGERSVIGGDAAGLDVPGPDADALRPLLGGADAVLLDGHHPELQRAVLGTARDAELPIVLDAGRWRPVMGDLVGEVTDVVASQSFRAPGADSAQETAQELRRRGARTVVVTDGARPVRWWDGRRSGSAEVPRVRAVDTLGAGDVFHGAYAYALAASKPLEERIQIAARAAAARCAVLGPRSWIREVARIGDQLRGS